MQRFRELVGAGIEALQRADTDALSDLSRRAGCAEAPTTGAERQAAADELLAFRNLLRLTRRNLLLLRGASCQRDTYTETGN